LEQTGVGNPFQIVSNTLAERHGGERDAILVHRDFLSCGPGGIKASQSEGYVYFPAGEWPEDVVDDSKIPHVIMAPIKKWLTK
jgi:hypothetical protein